MMTRYEGGYAIDAIVKENGLYLPCLIREMLKQKFGVDDSAVEVIINNPTLISDLRYVSLVCCLVVCELRWKVATGQVSWK